MGDRYFLTLDCPYCGHMNEDVYYAPSCDFIDHKCEKCGHMFDIEMTFVAVAREEVPSFTFPDGETIAQKMARVDTRIANEVNARYYRKNRGD